MSKYDAAISVVSILLVFAGLVGVLWILPELPTHPLRAKLLGPWNFESHFLFILIPLAACRVLRRNIRDYGLNANSIGQQVLVGGAIAVALFAVPVGMSYAASSLELNHSGRNFIWATLVFQLFFVGFGEEFLFRGFIQAELDRAFPAKFSWGHGRSGWALPITAFLFGVGHLLNDFNPLQGQFNLAWPAFWETAIAGLVLGYLRDYFNSIVLCMLIHSTVNLYASIFVRTQTGAMSGTLVLVVACGFLGWMTFQPLWGKSGGSS